MPETPPHQKLSRRERQIMDAVYGLGRASAAQVHERIPDAPSLTAVRTMLRTLEEKGHLRHETDGPRHVYLPTVPRDSAQRTALGHLVRTFFGGSPKAVVAALLDLDDRGMSGREREELIEMIRRSRERGE
ncbi:MAG: BlaI/MecI/CopY family transcriptional regulator [Gemmatimonadota bacterium]